MKNKALQLVLADSRAPKKKRSPLLVTACILVGRAGFEPATNGLKVRCSTS
jgi:hypothetical protein